MRTIFGYKEEKENMPDSVQQQNDELEASKLKYSRGKGANLDVLKDKKLKGQLALREELIGKSASTAAKTNKWLMPSEAGYLEAENLEKTYRISQQAIVSEVDILSSKKAFDIVLPDLGPYTIDYTSNGRYMAVAGRKGHLAILDMHNVSTVKEFQVKETVRDITFLHNDFFFAAAQKKYPYIYNKDGAELHCLKEHGAALRLKFLNNHFLLASVNMFGQLHYQDVTMGGMAGNIRTGLGRCDVMDVNRYNAVVGLGHSCGKITMWTPTNPSPLVNMLTHHGPVLAVAFHPDGHLMATAGMERKIKIWDLRKYEVLHTFSKRAKSLQFSQKGMLAVSNGSYVEVWKNLGGDNYTPDVTHPIVKGFQIEKVAFRPYEDVLTLGHSMGFSSILVPGSAEPNFDTNVANPYETSKQRGEREVHNALDKLPPETIVLDPKTIGGLRPRKSQGKTKQEKEAEMEAEIEAAKNVRTKKKTKGRSKPSKMVSKKKDCVIRAKRPFVDQHKKEEEQLLKKIKRNNEEVQVPVALQRFKSKKAH